MKASANRSLKHSLTRRLVAGLLAMGIVGALVAYAVSSQFANRAFDRTLFDDVKVLADQVRWVEGSTRVALTPDALLWLLADEGDNVIFRVTDLANGHRLASNGDLGDLPDLAIRPGEPYFRSTQVDGDRVRIAYVLKPVGPAGAIALVEIGETTRKRESISQSILIGSASMMAIFVVVAVALVWTGVASAFQPLQALELDAARRSATNLEPLDAGRAPAEVTQLIATFNAMLARVVDAIDAQRAFLANAAHQLKTPMAGLRLQAQLALSAKTIADAQPNMRAVEQRAAHGARLIDQLLALAHAESGETALPDARCDLAEVAAAVIERLVPQARVRDADLGFEHVGGPVFVIANPVLIGEMIANLVDNALRYGRDAGRVTVRVTREGTVAELAVIDDGPGFTKDAYDHLYRRFWRSDSSSGHGAGLGLAIVKEIVDRCRATLTVTSRPNVDGTVIAVRFVAA